MLKGETRPNLITWFIWLILQIIVALAQFTAGASWSIIIILVIIFNITLVILLIFKGYGYKKYGFEDYFCLLLAILAIVFWQITKNPLLAIFWALIADLSAVVPTLIKVYREPRSENLLSWKLNVLAAFLAILASSKIDFANLAFPIYYLFSDSAVVLTAIFRVKLFKIGKV